MGLAPEPALDAHLARDSGDLLGENRQRIGHVIDGVGQGGDFAFGLDGQFLIEFAVGHGGDHFDNAADLIGEVRRHDVHIVGEVLPGAGHPGHARLAAQLPVGAHLARHAGDFRRERI